jgi:hypothetical protein
MKTSQSPIVSSLAILSGLILVPGAVPAAESSNLACDWRFLLDRDDRGLVERWGGRRWRGTIRFDFPG